MMIHQKIQFFQFDYLFIIAQNHIQYIFVSDIHITTKDEIE